MGRAACAACVPCVLVALIAAACHDLPDLGTCGNGIIEEANGEACDDGLDSDTCTPRCELRCTAEPAGEAYVEVATAELPLRDTAAVYCPGARYRCGTDGICRAPSGRFEPPAAALPFDVEGSPVLGDVDNDGLLDLVGTSATNIYIRFASTEGAPLGDAVVQDAPSSDAPFVIFNPRPDDRDPMQAHLRIAVPTEGLALLRSDGERFTSELELPIPVTETFGLVVRDPDPAYGDVAITVERASRTSDIEVQRIEVPSPRGNNAPIVPKVDLPSCGPAAAEPWRTVRIEAVAADRRAFVIVTRRDGPDPAAEPWRVCRYTHAGASWARDEITLAAPAPSTAVLANLDADPCLELAVRGDGPGLSMVDAAGAGCAFLAAALPLPIAEGPADNAALLAAGPIVAGGLDELVLDGGVYRACAGAEDCGGVAPGTFVRAAAPTEARWSAAAVTDLNRDGALDVVAARALRPDVDVVRGGAAPNVYRADTSAPVVDLVAGDFDGDRLGDVAMVERSPMFERIVVLFGTQEAIVAAPRAIASISGALRLNRFSVVRWIPSRRGADGIDDLLVVDEAGELAGLLVGDAARLMTSPRFAPSADGRSFAGVAAGPFADPMGGVEVLALAGERALLYNVLGTEWAGPMDGIPVASMLRAPIANLRDGPGRALAASRGAGERDVVVFSVRGAFTSCAGTAAGEPVELRGIDIDGDGIDEVAVLFEDASGQRSLQMFRSAGCPLEPVLADVLEGCVDVANAGGHLVAICRPPAGAPMSQAARDVFTITSAGGRFERSPAPIAQVDGSGRFLTAGDYDGDGVLDVAIGVHRVSAVGVQLLRQCPAHDTRTCPEPED